MAPRYNPPTRVTETQRPYLALVTAFDPEWSRAKFWDYEYELASGKVLMANPYTRGAYNHLGNVYPVGQPMGTPDPAIPTASDVTAGVETPGLFKRTYVSNGGLLASPQNFEDSSVWSKSSNISVIPAATSAPDLTSTGELFREGVAASNKQVFTAAFFPAGGPYTFSCFLQAAPGQARGMELGPFDGSNGVICNFFPSTASNSGGIGFGGTPPIVSGVFMTLMGNGWYRCGISFDAAPLPFQLFIKLINSGGAGNYVGDGVSGMYVWGAQLVATDTPETYLQ